MINYTFLLLTYFIVFFSFGYPIVEYLLPNIKTTIKFPLYFISSILFSTYTIYLVSLVFGYTRIVVLAVLFISLLVFFFAVRKKYKALLNYAIHHKIALLVSFVVFVLYSFVLYPGIFGMNENYVVMSGSNWQDTPMHVSITESITEGNFPPQAPYFSGVPLTYYYFADYHDSIIELAYGHFLPKIFVFSNALLAAIFYISIYSLSFELTKQKIIANLSAYLATFFSSYHFYKFFIDLSTGGKVFDLLYQKSYSMEYDGLLGMANMADYFLQNRPMMIGLPTFICVVLLVIYGYRYGQKKTLFLAGLFSGLLMKFQFFCIIASALFFLLNTLLSIRKKNFIEIASNIAIYTLPVFGLYLIFSVKEVNSISFFKLVMNNFSFGTWDNLKSLSWHIKFILLNLGAVLLISITSLRYIKLKNFKILVYSSLIFILIPYFARFTIAGGDMLKFFYFSVSLMSITSVNFVLKIVKNRVLKTFIIVTLIFTSTFSSFLTLANSYINKNYAYSLNGTDIGNWIRINTPKKSIFITSPTIHSPASEIGGRLRVISYINWPYSHGFNIGEDNVFSRVQAVEEFYKNADNLDITRQIILRYGINYVYFGPDELSDFPEAKNKLESNNLLEKVYEKEDISLYKTKIYNK